MWGFGSRDIVWHEFDSSRVRNATSHLRPYSKGKFKHEIASGTLSVTSIQFFSSMARTAVLKKSSWLEGKIETVSFWIRYIRHFDKSKDIRLRDGSVSYYKDADRTYWASRIGEAYGYIEMQRRGYVIIDHMGNALSRISPSINIAGGADYYCRGTAGYQAIAEFKGHIVNPSVKGNTQIKSELFGALEQCDAVSSVLPSGHTASSYAVATYLRESNDPSNEPSLIAIADPDVTGNNLDLSDEGLLEAALRGNYGSWIQIMGLENVGSNIMNNKKLGSLDPLPLLLITYGNKRYVFIRNDYYAKSKLFTPIDINLGIHISFGLQEEIFKEIIVASQDEVRLSILEAIKRVMEKQDPQHDGAADSNIHLFNDGAIAISNRWMKKSEVEFEWWDPSV